MAGDRTPIAEFELALQACLEHLRSARAIIKGEFEKNTEAPREIAPERDEDFREDSFKKFKANKDILEPHIKELVCLISRIEKLIGGDEQSIKNIEDSIQHLDTFKNRVSEIKIIDPTLIIRYLDQAIISLKQVKEVAGLVPNTGSTISNEEKEVKEAKERCEFQFRRIKKKYPEDKTIEDNYQRIKTLQDTIETFMKNNELSQKKKVFFKAY